MPRDGGRVIQGREAPLPRGSSVGHGLLGSEGLGGDDEQGFLRIKIPRGFGEVRAIHIGDEAEGEIPLAVSLQSLVGHDGPQVGTTDADVHDVADGLPREPLPRAAAHLVHESGHAVQHLVYLRHYVVAIHLDAPVHGRAQGRVQHRAILGHVDLVAPKHRQDVLFQIRLVGQVQEQVNGLVRDAVL